MLDCSTLGFSSLGWEKGQRLGASAWLSPQSVDAAAGFVTDAKPGQLSPESSPLPWSLLPGFPLSASSVECLFLPHACLLRVHAAGQRLQMAMTVGGSGVLLGECSAALRPNLFSPSTETHEAEGRQWIEGEGASVVLQTQPQGDGLVFALVAGQAARAELIETLRAAMEGPVANQVAEAFARPAELLQRLSGEGLGGPLGETAVKHMAASLRTAQGALSHRWIASDDGAYSLNLLHPLAHAWSLADPDVAEDLIRTALGALDHQALPPQRIAANGDRSAEKAWPLLAQATLRLHRARANPAFLNAVLPRLRAYVQAAVQYFRPEGALPRWQQPTEAFVADTYDLGLVTADLAAFLIGEIHALEELSEAVAPQEPLAPVLAQARREMQTALDDFLWSEQAGVYLDRYAQGEPISRVTLSSVMPLLCDDLPELRRQALRAKLSDPKTLRQKAGAGLWQAWESDEAPPVVSALHQHFALAALADEPSSRERLALAASLRETLRERFAEHAALGARLDGSSGPSAVETAALAVVLACDERCRAASKPLSKLALWFERHRALVLGLPLAVFIAALLAIVGFYLTKETGTRPEMELTMGLAHRFYQDGRYDQAIALYRGELRADTTPNPVLIYRYANALARAGQWEKAAERYQALIEKTPSPQALHNLAIVLRQLDRRDEAKAAFRRIKEEFGSGFPAEAERARRALEVMDEEDLHSAPPPTLTP